MDRKSTVYVTKEDKDLLIEHIDAIQTITDKYPYSNDYSDYFVTTMSRVKTDVNHLREWIRYLDVK